MSDMRGIRQGLRYIGMATALTLLLAAAPASATSLMISDISAATLDGLTGAQVGATLTETFDFEPATGGGDGAITSQVFAGAGALEGNFVYLYQLELFETASEDKSSGVTFDFDTMPLAIPGVGEAFYVADGGGDVAPFIADYSGTAVTFIFFPFVQPGQSSFQLGLVSLGAPKTVTATVLDSGAVFGAASVYSNGLAPIPEPGASVLFIAGFLTVGIVGLRHQRKS